MGKALAAYRFFAVSIVSVSHMNENKTPVNNDVNLSVFKVNVSANSWKIMSLISAIHNIQANLKPG